ncbi:MAG: single-stranded-DNA-specific exonuclease RecJ [Flavobacteriaceae bacterium]|nr:single-stranded-DNA-specific exonuclease RecJ [Flavobacteriaceae bacterium]|tara:strand:+ start:3286 stop:4998 length:1713 start_codon:yes stop_codon:yes gene_type:complete
MIKKNWKKIEAPDLVKSKNLQNELNVPKLIAQLLVQRGIELFSEAREFFRPELKDLIDPFLMKGMKKAIDKIIFSIENKETIMIYGDYDVDGTTSVALLYSFLKKQGGIVIPYIPDRYKEGYGVSVTGINAAKEKKVSLIIIIDCGIKAIKEIELANSYGIDTIICDHHIPGKVLPNAVSILNPKQEDCSYPYKELCACGIGFKVIQAFEQKKGNSFDNIKAYLDLVAIAIAADIVPITGENRVLTFLGLKRLNSDIRIGLKHLINNQYKKLNIYDLIYKIAPRINAAGRMKHGMYAVDLLVSTFDQEAISKSRTIELFNSERKMIDERITKEALEQIELIGSVEAKTTVVYRPDWHKGVIGIVASRLMEFHYRPTIVFTKEGEFIVGSARSVKGFNIYEALSSCSKYLIQYGGHKYAAGLKIEPEKFTEFKIAFESAVSKKILSHQLIPSLTYDLEITLDKLTSTTFRIINQMRPFGPYNREPVFCVNNCLDNGGTRKVGKENNHLKLEIIDKSGTSFSGIGFNMAEYLSEIKSKNDFSILANLIKNDYNDRSELQLLIKSISFDKNPT